MRGVHFKLTATPEEYIYLQEQQGSNGCLKSWFNDSCAGAGV